MHPPEALRLLCWIAPWLCSCAHLPTVGLGVRSSWRAEAASTARHLEVLAGVSVGWSGASYAARSRPVAIEEEDPYAVAERALAYDGPACIEPLFCSWESAERASALGREGLRDEAREDLDQDVPGTDREGVTP